MEDIQWLAMVAVAIVAVAATTYFAIQNLQDVMQREWDAGYASGRVEAKLENLEQLVRVLTDDVRVVNKKMGAHDLLLRQMRCKMKKQGKRLRKRSSGEVYGPVPPASPTLSC